MDNYIVIIGRHWTLILILHGIESLLRGKENIVGRATKILRTKTVKIRLAGWFKSDTGNINKTNRNITKYQNWFFVVLNPDLNKQR